MLFSSCAVITIVEDLENPFNITFTWNDVTLLPDSDTGELPVQTLDDDGAVVQASVTDEDGNPVVTKMYEWYLNGELFEEGEDIVFISGTLEIGTYWLDLIVGKGEILSSEQVEFVMEK